MCQKTHGKTVLNSESFGNTGLLEYSVGRMAGVRNICLPPAYIKQINDSSPFPRKFTPLLNSIQGQALYAVERGQEIQPGEVPPWIPGQARNGDGGWYRYGFRVKPGMVTGGWYRYGFRVKPGMVTGGWYRYGFRVKPGMVTGGWYRYGFRVKPGMVTGGWYRYGFRVKPGMVTGGGTAMDSGSSPEW